MPSVKLKEQTTLEALNELLQARLSNECSAEIKNNRLRLVENKAKGCSVSLRIKNGETICFITGFMPSKVLRAALLVGIMIALSLATSLIIGEFSIVLGGALAFIIASLSMDVPSRVLVADITAIISSDLAQTAQPQRQSFRWWPIAGIAVCAIFLLGTVALVIWPASKPASVSPPEKSTLASPPVIDRSASLVDPAGKIFVREYSLAADVSGRIEFLHPNLKSGEIIPKETLIARINTGELTQALRRGEEELRIQREELALLEAAESVTKEKLEEMQRQLAIAQIEERHLLAVRQEVEHRQKNRDGLAKRRQLMASRISAVEQKLERLNEDLDRSEISLSFDVRINAVNVERDDFVAVGSVLFEATRGEK